MTSHQILQSDFLDILFDKRNKEYGAYVLRKSYNKEITKALLIAISVVFLLLFFINPSSNNAVVEKADEGFIIKDYKLAEAQKPKAPPVKPQPLKATRAKQQEFLTTKIVDKPVVDVVATQTQLINSQVSTITVDGPDVRPGINLPPAIESGNRNTAKEPEPSKEIKPDKSPQFPGGMQAWAAFLNGNLRAPQELESGEKRIVNIRFHVDADGTITNFQTVQSGGIVFDNEVIRVLKRMPKWMPAIQAGKPVAVSFTQPVTFVGGEE
ncbi:MAG TPA: TonB family protein [Flavisolibacter sp.]|nr:TonB family protein [Flavisolibacter sp.]